MFIRLSPSRLASSVVTKKHKKMTALKAIKLLDFIVLALMGQCRCEPQNKQSLIDGQSCTLIKLSSH